MKKLLLLSLFLHTFYFYSKAIVVNVTVPGKLSISLSDPSITDLVLTGVIDARDIKYIRDELPNIESLNMATVTIVAYSGTDGTSNILSDNYLDNTIPAYAFCDPLTKTGKTSLSTIIMPTNLTQIDKFAFWGCTELKGTLTIPGGVTIIGDEAFRYCKGLSGELHIPNQVVTLGAMAFDNATGFSDVYIPTITSTIGSYCFRDTPMWIHVDPNNADFASLDSILYNKSKTLLKQAPTQLTGTYTVPSTVTSIGASAFQNCLVLTKIILPSNLITIGDAAFYHCTNLTQELNLPSTLKAIGNNAFDGCASLTGALALPNNVLNLGNAAFYGCKGFNGALTLNDSINVVGSNAFEGCTGIKGSLVIPSKIKTIDVGTFKNTSGITSLSIPATVTTINIDAFNGCVGLQKINNASLVPLPIVSSVFKDVDKNTCTLYVPAGKKAAYSSANVWKDFKHIIEGKGFWISPTNVNVGKSTGSIATPKVSVFSNTTWTVTPVDNWLSATPAVPVNGDSLIIITATKNNPLTTTRTGTVTVSTLDGDEQTIVVSQAPGDPSLTVSSLTTTVAKESGAQTNINITSNTTWTVVSDQSWLSVNPTSFTGNGKLTFTTIQANPIFGTRTANVTITFPGSAPITVVVTQSDKTTLFFSHEPTLTTTKVYDKTTVANVVLGIMTGVDPLYPDVNVTAAANYTDSNVGTEKTIHVVYTATGADVSKYLIPSDYSEVGEITPVTLTVTALSDTRDYDATAISNKIPILTGSLIAPDAITSAATQSFTDKNASNLKTIKASGLSISDDNGGKNYKINYVNATGSLFPAPITVTAKTDSRMYDGTVTSAVAPTVTGIISPDSIATHPIQKFANKNVGIAKRIIASGLAISDGNSGNNYAVSYVDDNSGSIAQATVTVTAKHIVKVYDRTLLSDTIPAVTGIFPPDSISSAATQNFDNWDVGNNKTLTPSGLVIDDKNGGNNYIINYVPTALGEISPDTVTVTAQTYKKDYDRTTTSSVAPVVTGLIAPDAVAIAPTQNFVDFNAGINKTLTASGLSINDGNGGNNYAIKYKDNTTGEITPVDITVTAVSDSRTYDGTTASSKAPIMTGTLIAPDVVSTMPIQNFANRNAQTNKTINASGMVINDGNGGKNYAIMYVPVSSGTISPLLLTVKAQPDTKTYDGTDTSKVVPTVTGSVIAPDRIDTVPIQRFDTRKTGTNKTLTPTGMVISDGNNGGNYQILYISSNTGTITPAKVLIALTVSTRADDKVYDGTTKATIVNAQLNGIVPNDDVTVDSIIGTFAHASVGIDIPVNITLTLKGTDAINYTIVQPTGLVATITPKVLTVIGAQGLDKLYDATNTASIHNASLQGIVGMDDVTLTAADQGTFTQSNVGSNIGINTNFGLSGADAGNYKLTQPMDIKASITAKQSSVTSTAVTLTKIYDGTTTATIAIGTLSDVALADLSNLTLQATATYNNANVGTAKTITVKFTLTGSASNNYLPPVDVINTAGIITHKQLTISATTVEKVKMHDGNTNALIKKIGDLQGVIANDTSLVHVNALANYDNSSVGNNKNIIISYSLTGTAKDNYLAPINEVINDGKILDVIKLSPLVRPTTGCEGENMVLSYTLISGESSEYKITFDTAALATGMKNIDYTPLLGFGSTGTISIPVPIGVKFGNYHAILQMKNQLGAESPAYDFSFTINLSTDFIVSKFDDVVICDNSSWMFKYYQWYKNNELIAGATDQFYFEPQGLVGSYSLKVTTTDGKTLYCCPKEYNKPKIQKVGVFPNPAKSNEPITIQVLGFKDTELQQATLAVYSVQGQEIYKTKQIENTNKLNMSLIPGIYVGRLTLNTGKIHVFEIVVNN